MLKSSWPNQKDWSSAMKYTCHSTYSSNTHSSKISLTLKKKNILGHWFWKGNQNFSAHPHIKHFKPIHNINRMYFIITKWIMSHAYAFCKLFIFLFLNILKYVVRKIVSKYEDQFLHFFYITAKIFILNKKKKKFYAELLMIINELFTLFGRLTSSLLS